MHVEGEPEDAQILCFTSNNIKACMQTLLLDNCSIIVQKIYAFSDGESA